MYLESRKRSIAKALSWRFWATLTTIALVFLFTGKPVIAVSIGGFEVVAKMLLYFFHERSWNRIRLGRYELEPFVIWFTGLPSSEREVISERVTEKLKKKNMKMEYLSSATVQNILPESDFCAQGADEYIRRIGFLAKKFVQSGVFITASFVSPCRKARELVRLLCPLFIEVYVYKLDKKCEEESDSYEVSESPEIKLNMTSLTVDEAVTIVMRYLKKFTG